MNCRNGSSKIKWEMETIETEILWKEFVKLQQNIRQTDIHEAAFTVRIGQ
jgi:hypothetical protein